MLDRNVQILSVADAAEHLDTLVRRVEGGSEIGLARGGKIVAKLVRPTAKNSRAKTPTGVGKRTKSAKGRLSGVNAGAGLGPKRLAIVEKLRLLNRGNKASRAAIVSIVREGRE